MSQNQTPQRKWRTISVPAEVFDLLKRIESRSNEDKAHWKIILKALSFYEDFRSKPKLANDFSIIEKISWYITKLSLAYGTFAVNPSEESANQLKERLQEIEVRTGVQVGALLKLIDQYIRIKDENERKKARMELNQAFKLIIKEMIIKSLEAEQNDSTQSD